MAAPDPGDLVWINFDPQAGREQSGRRPALVLTPRRYHQVTHLTVVCPITSTRRGYPFEIPLPDGLPIRGVVLADQVKSIDRRARMIEPAGQVPSPFLAHVLERLISLLTGRMPMEDFDA